MRGTSGRKTAVRRSEGSAPMSTERARQLIVSLILCGVLLTSSAGLLFARADSLPWWDATPSHAATLLSTTTVTDTPTDTPTNTPTNTPTDTPTDTPTSTPTSTPTATPTGSPTATATLTATATPTPTLTVLDSRVQQAIQIAHWPQQQGNWCGIATVAAIAAYLNPHTWASQSAVTSTLNSSQAISEWGYPRVGGGAYLGPYLAADISGDFGTDPRSIAEGLTLSTGLQYHAIVDTNGAWDATVHIVDDMIATQQPISVFVDHGQHSVLVTGVETAGGANPVTNPGAITALHIFDPGVGANAGIQAAVYERVPIILWLSGAIPNTGDYYFAYPYAANWYHGYAFDPDPSVGPYTYVSWRDNHLWVGQYVYVSPVAPGATARLNADWELTPGGALIAGITDTGWAATPAGYSGPVVSMPMHAPPPAPPVHSVQTAPPLTPPAPTATPKPTATPIHRARPTPASGGTTAPVPTLTAQATPVCAEPSCVWSAMLGDMGGTVPLVLTAMALLLIALVLWLAVAAQARGGSARKGRRRAGNTDDPHAGARSVPILTPRPPSTPGSSATAETPPVPPSAETDSPEP